MSGIRWEGYSHKEIYEAVHAGPGRAASAAAESAWAEVEALILRIDERITAAMNGSASGWEGGAADAARTAVSPLGQWALDAAMDARITAQAVSTQAGQAQELRNTMPEPYSPQLGKPTLLEGMDPARPMEVLTDLAAAEHEEANRAARAVDLMNTYTNNSYENRRHMDYWTLPPQVTVETTVPPPPPPRPRPAARWPWERAVGSISARRARWRSRPQVRPSERSPQPWAEAVARSPQHLVPRRPESLVSPYLPSSPLPPSRAVAGERREPVPAGQRCPPAGPATPPHPSCRRCSRERRAAAGMTARRAEPGR